MRVHGVMGSGSGEMFDQIADASRREMRVRVLLKLMEERRWSSHEGCA